MVLVGEIEIPWIHIGAEFFTRPFPVVVGKARGGGGGGASFFHKHTTLPEGYI